MGRFADTAKTFAGGQNNFLPLSSDDFKKRGWDALDIILITGDAYVDHPSYGAAVIGRVLENAGYRVGIIPQPDWRKPDDFGKLGKPRLFFGITAGNMDSMVANYTANKRPRQKDDYSPGGKAGLRPDRATIVYANRIREAFGDIPIVIGGIEASLRRFAHYDWWDNAVRRSILLDSRADILVYGMGERQVVEIAERLSKSENLSGIRGTAIVTYSGEPPLREDKRRAFNSVAEGFSLRHPKDVGRGTWDSEKEEPAKRRTGDNELVTHDDLRFTRYDLRDTAVEIPSYEEVKEDKEKFNEAFRLIYQNQDPFTGKTIIQRYATRCVIQYPPPLPLTEYQLDAIYELPYMKNPHPSYKEKGSIPGFETVRFSLISHRGCCGECSFCALSMHQGRIVQSRSKKSILREATLLTKREDFRGTITDIGGPTANLYKAKCPLWDSKGACRNKQCLMPEKCKNLKTGYRDSIELYNEVLSLPKVKHVFLESGIRYDLLTDNDSTGYFSHLCTYHISGQMKVAPEHTVDRVLKLMNKPPFHVYETFAKQYIETNRRLKKDQYLVHYFISAHPGSTLEDTFALSQYLMKRKIHPEQIQDFIPLPLTLSGCMYYTEKHPFTGEKVYVAKTFRERKMHRALIQYKNPKNKKLIEEAMKILKKRNKSNSKL
ncbi:MAG: YgiQ family radical SAM protein [Proteobacteria bacterium]|nr:YgiQ family radical SAM protein [Pseudomonadota bacterium]